MNLPTLLSQRDTKWNNEKLGFSNTTIGNFGCTITALTSLARLDDPRKINEILKQNQGFANGNLVIWDKVSTIPGLKFIYRHYDYNNEKVKEIIKKNGACLIEVDGAPIGGVRHWLLYIGNKKLIDPWDGKIKSTETYNPIAFVDIGYTEQQMSSPSEELVKIKADLTANIEQKEQCHKALSETQKERDGWRDKANIFELQLNESKKKLADIDYEVKQWQQIETRYSIKNADSVLKKIDDDLFAARNKDCQLLLDTQKTELQKKCLDYTKNLNDRNAQLLKDNKSLKSQIMNLDEISTGDINLEFFARNWVIIIFGLIGIFTVYIIKFFI